MIGLPSFERHKIKSPADTLIHKLFEEVTIVSKHKNTIIVKQKQITFSSGSEKELHD